MTAVAREPALAARQVRITGVVQGVGFRPFVHRLAVRHDLRGWVQNVGGEVAVHVEGAPAAIDAFLVAVREEAPPLARIEAVIAHDAAPTDAPGFTIAESSDPAGHRQPVSPDAALCPACAAELFDPANRRYRYPFITCTDCGPRFTVIEAMPYDRARTSMRMFTQCPTCAAEYADPTSRRYHSETNSCPACGPRLWFEDATGAVVDQGSEAALASAAALLRRGGILALRGLGGFHLAVDATTPAAVQLLRERKHRDAKPFAVMVRTIEEAATLAEIEGTERELLTSYARPVVLLRRRIGIRLAAAVAPGLDRIGLLLPATPLHQLLLDEVGRPLVMTSGNLSEEPIAIGNAEARERLGAIADGFLLHDREIVARYDDSVVRVVDGRQLTLRRARGIAPLPAHLPVPTPRPLLAVGADLKNTFTLADGHRAYLSQHLGDLASFETVSHAADTRRRFEQLFQVAPTVAVHDRHPGYHSTRIAQGTGLPTFAVQHHHAHIAAVMAEHGVTTPVVGVAWDGTGYGNDGAVWGAEIFVADLLGFDRVGQLRYAPLPGGDLAAREPWRAALGYRALAASESGCFARAFDGIPDRELAIAEQQIARNLNTPLASSMGRLFDAVAAVLGVRRHGQFEGQAAMELEALAGSRPGRLLPFPVRLGASTAWELDPLPLLVALGDLLQRGVDVRDLAASFHRSVIAAATTLVHRIAASAGLETVVLGGGSFQNARLATELPARLRATGLTVLLPHALPPNDGAISYGQAAVAAAHLAQARPSDFETGGVIPCA